MCKLTLCYSQGCWILCGACVRVCVCVCVCVCGECWALLCGFFLAVVCGLSRNKFCDEFGWRTPDLVMPVTPGFCDGIFGFMSQFSERPFFSLRGLSFANLNAHGGGRFVKDDNDIRHQTNQKSLYLVCREVRPACCALCCSKFESFVKNVNDIRHKPPGPTPAKLSAEIAPHIL